MAMQIFVRGLSGETSVLELHEHETVCRVRETIGDRLGYPVQNKQLTFLGRSLDDDRTLAQCRCINNSTLHLTGFLPGGKGGFGANLRAGKGNKETTNFTACRDLNGRRLAVSDAEKKLEEWKTQEEERRLQKIAETHLRKVEREKERKGKEKVDIQTFRENLAETSERVASAVRDGLLQANKLHTSKRKEGSNGPSTSKKAKTWDSFDDSDSDSESDFIPDAPSDVKVESIPEVLQHKGKSVKSNVPAEPVANGMPGKSAEKVEEGDNSAPDVMSVLKNSKSAKDLEVIGLLGLKETLQKYGLKCGGSLSERASRLFLLKTHGRDKIDKKHLAKGSDIVKKYM